MRVFVTGATGFIGSKVVKELIDAGHQVLGLARSEQAASSLIAAGAKVHRGDLEDLDSLRSGAEGADGVIHTGFIHDFSRFKEVCEVDRKAIGTLGDVLAGSDRPLIVTSGILLLAPGHLATEADMPPAVRPNPRMSEEAADAAAAQGVRSVVVRLAPTVHGAGDKGFITMLINIAREKGVSAYIGAGLNRWTAVHRLDAAHLFRLAVEQAPAAGSRLHGVAEEGIAFRDIAETIGQQLNIPVVSISQHEAAAHFGWFEHFAGADSPASSIQTQERLDWHPIQPGLITDMVEHYFKTA